MVFELVCSNGCPRDGDGQFPVTKSLISRCISVLTYVDLGQWHRFWFGLISVLWPFNTFYVISGAFS